jgi:putative transposase
MYYVRYSLSYRQVEDILYECGIDICYETVRYWVARFGLIFASEIRQKRKGFHSNGQWHLDEVFVKINDEQFYLWRAVDHEGEVLESIVTKRRNKIAALKFISKTIKKQGVPRKIITDKLRSYSAALKIIGASTLHDTRQYLNNRCENLHLSFRRRERAMLRFRRLAILQKFTSIHSQIFNHGSHQRHLQKRNNFIKLRTASLSEWRGLCAA